nr:hypothetical protein [Tanacetum cinerariifolium]
VKENPKKDKIGQKREAWRSQKKSEAVTVERGRKTEENTKRMARNAHSCKDAHIGYNCPSKVLVISIPEPYNNQTIDELPQVLPIFHPTFHSEAESPFTLDSTPTYVDESPNVFNPPPQPPVYPCEICGNNAYFGHYCTPQAPFLYPEPCYNQDFNFPQNIQNVPQQYPCCDDCGVTHDAYQFIPTEPIDSISLGDEHLDTIPATKSSEFIKSYVENLVPNPSESEGENGCYDDDYDSGRDIPILEELLDNYSLSLPANESYHFDIPSPYRPPAKPRYGNTGTLNIKMPSDVSDQKVLIPNLTITRVLNQEKSLDLLSHLGFEAFQPSAECLMIINGKNTPVLDVPLFHFYPLINSSMGGIRSSSAT